MITLAADCLVFQLADGANVPFSADMVSVELMGETGKWFDPEFVHQATKAVFHYFKHEQGRQKVSMGEFAEALEKVLSGFLASGEPQAAEASPSVIESDLSALARESGECWELLFYSRLREELRRHAQQRPAVLRFSGLRQCVKQLAGTNRWSTRCRNLQEQIVAYVRQCLSTEMRPAHCSVVIE